MIAAQFAYFCLHLFTLNGFLKKNEMQLTRRTTTKMLNRAKKFKLYPGKTDLYWLEYLITAIALGGHFYFNPET